MTGPSELATRLQAVLGHLSSEPLSIEPRMPDGMQATLEFEPDEGPHRITATAWGENTVQLMLTLDTATASRLMRAYGDSPDATHAGRVGAALKHLTTARDLLKAAGCSTRLLAKLRLTISSAKGALRHAEHKDMADPFHIVDGPAW